MTNGASAAPALRDTAGPGPRSSRRHGANAGILKGTDDGNRAGRKALRAPKGKGKTQPKSTSEAQRAAAPRFSTASFARMCSTCVATVRRAMPRITAISGFVFPCAIQ